MKIFMTGASGMLAAEVTKKFENDNHQIIKTDKVPRLPDIAGLDITNKAEVLKTITAAKPDYVFHFAAETNVDLCEQNPRHAFLTNTVGTEHVALACRALDTPMLYISTAGVFFGDKPEPYNEFDVPHPANLYGLSKLQGEYAVKNFVKKWFIVRAGWMVGGWEIDKKFVYKIVQQILSGKKELTVVSDKYGSPTFTKDFANNLTNVLDTGLYGLYHMTNKGTGSRYEIAIKIVEFMGLKGKIKVNPVNSAQYPLPAPRARSECMDNLRLEILGLNHMPHWEESLREYIETNVNRK